MLSIIDIPIRPVIGSKFTGKHQIVHNQGTGEFQECLPQVDVLLQQSLIQNLEKVRRTYFRKEPSNG